MLKLVCITIFPVKIVVVHKITADLLPAFTHLFKCAPYGFIYPTPITGSLFLDKPCTKEHVTMSVFYLISSLIFYLLAVFFPTQKRTVLIKSCKFVHSERDKEQKGMTWRYYYSENELLIWEPLIWSLFNKWYTQVNHPSHYLYYRAFIYFTLILFETDSTTQINDLCWITTATLNAATGSHWYRVPRWLHSACVEYHKWSLRSEPLLVVITNGYLQKQDGHLRLL